MLSAFAPTALAFDFMRDGICYDIAANGKSVTVTYHDINDGFYTGDVVIPDSVIHGLVRYPVKEIGQFAFFNCQGLNSVTMGNEITAIGDQAFCYCYWLTDVRFSQRLQRIGDYAFQYCEDLTEVNLPASLTFIGSEAFTYCRSLSAFNIDDDNNVYTAIDGVLYTKSRRQLVMYPAAKTDPDLILPDETEILQYYALAPQPHLHTITLGPKLKTLRSGTFSECTALREINVSPDNPYWCSIDGVIYDKNVTTLLAFPMYSVIDAFEVPSTVTTLADLSMLSAKRIIELSLPASLTHIGDYALMDCSSLLRVTSLASVPPKAERNPINTTGMIFSDVVYSQASLTVPPEAFDTYCADPEWGRFRVINDVDRASLSQVTATENHAGPVFDIMGRRHRTPFNGLNIIGRRKIIR
ncbi:MAG: leucine-rich repeat domain-containing protein [Muribaculaceae bacterium]|nr:leucine-rich repeat domain-containing protein [Muribaculaceae bacterium]